MSSFPTSHTSTLIMVFAAEVNSHCGEVVLIIAWSWGQGPLRDNSFSLSELCSGNLQREHDKQCAEVVAAAVDRGVSQPRQQPGARNPPLLP